METNSTGRGYGNLVLMNKKDKYAVVTLNRPEKRNAMSKAAQAELCAALEDAREGSRVIILTGAGDRSFCSGIDLSEVGSGPQRRYAYGSASWFETQEVMKRHPAIFIAAVNGLALGGGLTLVHNCQLAIASERAEFGMPEIGFGTFPSLSGPSSIKRMLPKHYAYMILTARRIHPEMALRWGIVNEVVPHEQLIPKAEELARHIAQFDAVVLDYTKKALWDIPMLEWSDAIDRGLETSQLLRGLTKARDEGVSKFLGGERNPGQGAG